MTTYPIQTITVTIDAPYEAVARDLADPAAHPQWATEFFTGSARPGKDGEVILFSPFMGGDVRFRIDADVERGIIDLYLAPGDAPFGPPLPVRLLPNGDGVDVLWTLSRFPGTPEERWQAGIASMERELQSLKQRHEK